MSREAAVELRDAVGAAVSERREFLRTVGEFRADGTYAVERRGADSTGNRQVFDSFDALCRLYEHLPARFDADAVGEAGVTGSRRHLVARHFAEHPEFDCGIDCRSPLTVRKVGGDGESTSGTDPAPASPAPSSQASADPPGEADTPDSERDDLDLELRADLDLELFLN